jgi:hypothetical protein
LKSGWCCLRFDIADLPLIEDQQTTNHSLRQCPISGEPLASRCVSGRSK